VHVFVLAAVVLAGLFATVQAGGAPPRPPSHPSRAGLPAPDPLLRDLIGFRVRYRDLLRRHDELVRTVPVRYRAWDGRQRIALLVLPRWYGPKRHPSIPLVISPHGRGVTPRDNTRFWGGLPAFGPFAVVNPNRRCPGSMSTEAASTPSAAAWAARKPSS